MINLKMFILFQENIVIILLFDCGYLAFFKKKEKRKKRPSLKYMRVRLAS